MKFGKLPTVEKVDFTLPPEPRQNDGLFARLPKAENANLYIGATGWGMKEWVGKYYPAGAKAPDFLKHYAAQFNTIELNTTHYRIPDELTIQKWKEQSAPDFKFCPKVPQVISHSRGLSPGGPVNLVRQFCEAVKGLEEKLGPCFIQLPPYFGADRLPVLSVFLENWHKYGVPLALEVRHESWFEGENTMGQLADTLAGLGASMVITDVAGRRDVCHMHLTTDTAVVRFVGNGLHPTDFSRIDAWVERLRHWFENGLKSAYFFTHEPDNILAPELATFLYEKAKGMAGISVRGPALLQSNNESEQLSLF